MIFKASQILVFLIICFGFCQVALGKSDVKIKIKEDRIDLEELSVKRKKSFNLKYDENKPRIVFKLEKNDDKNGEKIEKRVLKIFKNSPTDPKKLIQLGLLLSEYGHYKKAIMVFEKALKQGFASTSMYEGWGETLILLKKYEDALEIFRGAVSNKYVSEIIYIHLGNLMFNLERYDRAIDNYRKAVESEDSSFIFLLLVVLRQIDDPPKPFDEGFKILEEALNRQPNSGIYYTFLGAFYAERSQFEKALNAVEVSLKKNPKSAGNYRLLGTILANTGKASEALSNFEKASKLNPKDSTIYVGWASALIIVGKYQEARVMFEKALSMDDGNSIYLFAFGNFLLHYSDDLQLARGYLEKAVSDDKPYPVFYYTLAMVYVLEKKPYDALRAYRNGLKIGNQDIFTVINLLRNEFELVFNKNNNTPLISIL